MKENDRRKIIIQEILGFFNNDNEAAQQWMRHPVKGLGNRAPIDMITTDADTKIVLDLIARLDHGVFS